MKVLVIGASRGIGLELVRQYRAEGADVTASARSEEGLARLRALGAAAITVDVADAASAAGLGWQIEGQRFDVAIVNAGVSGTRVAPLEPPTEENFDLVMRTNVLGPMRVIPAIADALAPGARLAVLSSRMGSIAESSGGYDLYRMSKAAQNILARGLFEQGAKRRGIAVLSLHPGWVQTDMGGPAATLTVGESVRGLADVLSAEHPAEHRFLAHDGSEIPW